MTAMKNNAISDDETDTILHALRFVRAFSNFHFVKIINSARNSCQETHYFCTEFML